MIRKQRQKLRITQKQLSEIVGVSQAYISKIESDKFTNVTFTEIIKLARALKLSELQVCEYFLKRYKDSF